MWSNILSDLEKQENAYFQRLGARETLRREEVAVECGYWPKGQKARKEEAAAPPLNRVRLRWAGKLLCTPSLYHHHCKLSVLAILQFSSAAQSCPTLCDPMNLITPGLPVHHCLPEFTQTHVHWVRDAIQPSYPLSSPSPPAPNPSQHQSLFQWVSSSHEVAKVLELQL